MLILSASSGVKTVLQLANSKATRPSNPRPLVTLNLLPATASLSTVVLDR